MRKRRAFMIFSVFLQIFMFLILPYKEILLSIGIIFMVLILAKIKILFIKNFITLISLFGIGSIFVNIYLKAIVPFSLFVRLIFEPAKIKFQYFDFFNNNSKLLYSEGLIGKLFGLNYPYSQPIGFVIFNYFEPLGRSNSNTGYIAYAFANAGLLGMIVMSILFALILLILDGLVGKRNFSKFLSLLMYPMILLNDGDLLTILLTGGLFLMIAILFFDDNFGDLNSNSTKEDFS